MKLSSDPGLRPTQRWMQDFILAQDAGEPGIQEGLALVLPSPTLTAGERAGIYRDMYLARLVEALETDYPGLLHYLGKNAFEELVARYVAEFPSRSYTLNRLGDHLPEFLTTQTRLPGYRFLHDLARLELALTEVFDAEESPLLTQADIEVVPPDAWETARLKPVAAFRLLAFGYPVSEYLGAVDRENPFPRIRRRATWVAAYRRNYAVHCLDLKRPAFELLTALVSATPIGKAVVHSRVGEQQLFEWFREWTSAGFFQSVVFT